MAIVNKQASRPTTGRRHSKEVLLSYRTLQLDSKNEYGWTSRACENDFHSDLTAEQLCLQQLLLEPEPKQVPDFACLSIGPPPGLELCDVSHSSIGKDDSFFSDGGGLAMPTDAMLASGGCENSFFAGRTNQTVPAANTQANPKSSLHICLVDCIDDTSTVASENSPELFPRDLIDAGSAQSSANNGVEPIKKKSTKSVPSLAEALSFEPRVSVPSLAEALDFGTPLVTPKASTPISLEAMLELSPAKNPAISQEGTMKSNWNASQVPFGMLPMGGVCPWWLPNFPTLHGSSNSNNSSNNNKSNNDNNTGPLPACHAGYAGATTFWPATGSWGHSMHTNNFAKVPKETSIASNKTTDTSDIFQI